MQIYTSSWFTPLPDAIQKVGISRGTPRGYPPGYRRLAELAPGPWFNSVGPEEYHQRFAALLAAIDPMTVLAKIEAMGGGRDVALLCYESPDKPADWCHRGQVSAWLRDTLGIDVYEFGHEGEGCGHKHPKLPTQFRAGA